MCRPWGHFYDTIYDKWMAPYVAENNPMQLLEIGYYKGEGFEAFSNFFLSDNKWAELHSVKISCIEPGPRDDRKWPWENFAIEHRWYQDLRDKDRLHCGDASNYDVLENVWTIKMKRKDSPPLEVAASPFHWFPRIELGGILVVVDIEPIEEANTFRTHIVPQVTKDLN